MPTFRAVKVLVHGNPETDAVWDPLVARLLELGHDEPVRLSPPGFGAPVPDGWGATLTEYRDALGIDEDKLNVDAARRDPDPQAPLDAAAALCSLGSGSALNRDYAAADRWLDAAVTWCAERDLDSLRGYASAWQAAQLTDRQVDVLGLLVGGLRNVDIAARLHISPKTVDHHVSAILAKLGVGSRQEAAHWVASQDG